MTLEQYRMNVLTQLGAPLLDIEIAQDASGNEDTTMIDRVIYVAFNELREYVDTPYFVTLNAPPVGPIDTTEYSIRAVQYVMRGTMNYWNAQTNIEGLLWSPLATFMTQSENMGYSNYSQANFLQDYIASLHYKQLRNTLNQDLDYTFDSVNQKLYIYQQIPRAPQITIAFNKRYEAVEELEEPYWINMLTRLATAYAKIVVGRIRSKFKMTAAPYTLDGEALISEGTSEITEIRTFLNDNNNIFIPRD